MVVGKRQGETDVSVRGTRDLVWSAYTRALRLRKRSQYTITSYTVTYQQLSNWAGKPGIECSRPEIEEFLVQRMDSVAPATVSQNTLNLKIFFKWAVSEDWISSNPMERIPVTEVEAAPKQVMSDQDLKLILKACSGKRFEDLRDLALIRVLCEVGTPRLGELISMTLESVNLGHDLLELVGKTGTRFIPIGDKTAQALERYLRVRTKHRLSSVPELWLGKFGPLGRNGIQQMIKRRGEAAGIPYRVHPHLFRHATASRASAAGISDSLMEPLYGWVDNSRMTRVYGRSTRVSRAQNKARELGLGDSL